MKMMTLIFPRRNPLDSNPPRRSKRFRFSTVSLAGTLCGLAFLVQTASRAGDAGVIVLPTSPPPVVFSVEPEEDGKFVIMRVPPGTANGPASSLLGLRVKAVNNGTSSHRLNTIRVRFPGFPALTTDLVRDETFASGETKTLYMDPDESIQLPQPPPPSVVFELRFDGYVMPATITRSLAFYEAPGGFFLFPGNAKDLPADHYWTHKARHTGGSQFFGYDMGIKGWDPASNQFTSTKPGGSPDVNADNRAWNTPVYAMQDGVVITAQTGMEDNPAPGTRSVQRMGDVLAGAITDVKMTKLGASRAASVVRLPSGNLKVIVWDTADLGREILRRGDVEGEAVESIATDALSGSRLVTTVRLPGGNMRVIVWGISSDGQTVTRLSDRDAAEVEEVSMVKLTSTRFATAARTQDGTLRLIVWEVSNDGTSIALLSHAFAGAASSVSVSALSATRLATTLRDAAGNLKCIVWDLLDDAANTLARRGDATGAAVSKVVSVRSSSTELVTAAQTAAGTLEVARWSVSEDGMTLQQEAAGSAGQIEDVSLAVAWDEAVMTAVITSSGDYKKILREYPGMTRWGEAEAGATEQIDIDALDTAQLISGVRTDAGNLKVITWFCGSGGGNSLRILHGDCIVLYAHFKAGSVNPAVAFPGAKVHAGQYLARLGNSGSSSGPHLHIHSTRVSSFVSAAELIELAKTDDLPYIAYRPIPWHGARTMHLDLIQPGGLNNPANKFSTMTGHGGYFEVFGILPNWQLPKEPWLTIRASAGSATIEWAGTGQRLQYNDDISSARWQDFPAGTSSPLRMPAREAHRFFRLERDPSQLSDFGLQPTAVIRE
jgi:murein DD-endopeptidase MepM/ murein hydrolase activator NlpD